MSENPDPKAKKKTVRIDVPAVVKRPLEETDKSRFFDLLNRAARSSEVTVAPFRTVDPASVVSLRRITLPPSLSLHSTHGWSIR